MFKAYTRRAEVGVAEITSDLLNILQTGGANPDAKVGDLLLQQRDEKGNPALKDGRPIQEIVTAAEFAASGFKPKFGMGKPKAKEAVTQVEVPQGVSPETATEVAAG